MRLPECAIYIAGHTHARLLMSQVSMRYRRINGSYLYMGNEASDYKMEEDFLISIDTWK